jgi:hypothetical protein
MLGNLNTEMQVLVGHLKLVMGGVADVLEIASRRENEVNGPALAYVVRPALELAGQIAWLLSEQIDGEQRTRRYLAWRFADLRAQRLLLRDFRASRSLIDAATKELDDIEDEIFSAVVAAKWTAQRTTYPGTDIQPAALLGSDGKPERVPGLGELVRSVSSTPATYGLLSVTSHSQRFGILQGLKVVASTPDGQQQAQVSGFPLDPSLLIGLSVLAVDVPSRMLGGWNAVDASELHEHARQLMTKSGLR